MKRFISILALLFVIPCAQAMEPEQLSVDSSFWDDFEDITEYDLDEKRPSKIQKTERMPKIEAVQKVLPADTINKIEWLKDAAKFEKLPNELKQQVIQYLVTSPGFLEKTQLEEASNNIRSLKNSCNTYRAIIDTITPSLINELAARYTNGNKISAAIALRTKTSGQWLVANYTAQNKSKVVDSFSDAIRNGKTKTVRFLLHFLRLLLSVKIYENGTTHSPLSLAAASEYSEVLKLLLKEGAKVNDFSAKNPLISAIEHVSVNNVATLLAVRGIKINTPINNPLLFAVAESCRQLYRIPPLAQKIRDNSHIIVQKLLEAGADINFQDALGQTALMEAVSANLDVLKTLLAAKNIELNLQDINGNTALIKAVRAGYIGIIEPLLKAGASPNVCNKEGKSALDYATDRDDWLWTADHKPKIIELLKQYGAKPGKKPVGSSGFRPILPKPNLQ